MRRLLLTICCTFFLASATWASDCPDCPAPKPLSCERLKALEAIRCQPESPKPCAVQPCATQPCGAVPCAAVPCKAVDCAPTVVTAYVNTTTPAAPKGHLLLGAGPMWSHRDWGATAIVGYQFKSGWQIQAGPTWQPHRAVSGTVNPCDNQDGKAWCVDIPFHVERRPPWGAQALLVYAF